ncbi:DUF1697 domain-containing protein [Antrihabitans cavernicola]|uniref:DUF1697 domain-containing protein n=1 Tax=Antrihabitans cavernicola TaxID=2495913 RepID=A0A5A7SA83_9NOCA|nr:DUF1697 domain-containing protein [Spelaeibacter cavernicola]KAA0023060.1 DUF1697 domain-containing protein [Spelaeibacter cavernicola]
MTQYVAFLRGVNVGGINIKMADLKQTFVDLGFDGVRTILASGNVAFESSRTGRAKLKKDIESALNQAFGYEAWIVLVDIATVQRIIDDYPFDPEHEGWHPYVLLSSDDAVLDDLLEMKSELDGDVEQIAAGDGVLYWEVERGQTLQSPFGKRTGNKRYKSATTTRNLRTLLKVVR